MNVRYWYVALLPLMIFIFVVSDVCFVGASSPDVPTMVMIVDAPQTAVEGTTIVLHVRFFNIEPSNVSIRAFGYNGYSQSDYPIVRFVAGAGGTLDIPVGSYRRDWFSVKVPMFSDKYPGEDSWPIRWAFSCIYYSPLYGQEMAFISSSTTIVTSSKTTKEPDINENGLIIQTSTVTLAPGETGKTTLTVMNLLPVDLNCITSVFAFNSESKSGGLYLSPFESEEIQVNIQVPKTTDPGTYSYLAGVNAHEADGKYQGKSFTAYSSGAIKVEERESSGDLDFDCIIATAAYGSAMNPTVSMMRHLRDLKIGSTFTGHNFVQIFNTWYYSWSPPVAKFVGLSEARRALARILLTPLTQTMTASDSVYDLLSWSPEAASLAALQSSAFLCGLLYVAWPLLIVLKMNPMNTGRKKLMLAIGASFLSSATLMLVGHLLLNSTISSLGSVTLSVSTMLVGAYTMTRIVEKVSMLLFKEWDHHARSKHRTPTP